MTKRCSPSCAALQGQCGSSLPLNACDASCVGNPGPLSRPGLSNSTMSQKSSLVKTLKSVPRALTSDSRMIGAELKTPGRSSIGRSTCSAVRSPTSCWVRWSSSRSGWCSTCCARCAENARSDFRIQSEFSVSRTPSRPGGADGVPAGPAIPFDISDRMPASPSMKRLKSAPSS